MQELQKEILELQAQILQLGQGVFYDDNKRIAELEQANRALEFLLKIRQKQITNAEYEEHIAELEHKLAEQQALLARVRDYGKLHCVDVWNICVAYDKNNTKELDTLLIQARGERSV